MATHYYAVSWDQLHRDARALAWRLMDRGPFSGIVAITRGGLIPAAIIARELDVRLVESVSIVSYAAGSGGSPASARAVAAFFRCEFRAEMPTTATAVHRARTTKMATALSNQAARTGRWKGIFAVHSWIVLKPENAKSYTRYDLTGFGRPLHVDGWAPDARWFGNTPQVIADIRGPAAALAIPKIRAAILAYPFAGLGDYRLWPGPNSNTFVANVLRAAPELDIALPP